MPRRLGPPGILPDPTRRPQYAGAKNGGQVRKKPLDTRQGHAIIRIYG